MNQMPKINAEEYEALKDLDDRWELIARNSDGKLWVTEATTLKKNSLFNYWLNVQMKEEKELSENLFQFIQWEDEEPYSIAELIEEYEQSLVEQIYEDEKETFEKLAESEESEVKKDKKWFVDKWTKQRNKTDVRDPVYYLINEFIADVNQLDEPEVLSDKWIDEHKYFAKEKIGEDAVVKARDLRNLLVPKREEITEEQAYDKIAESFPATAKEIESVLEKYYSSMFIEFSEELHESIMRAFDVEVTSKTIEALAGMTLEEIKEEVRNGGFVPKQELPVIPNYVAKWISENHERFDLYPALKRLENNALSWEDVYEWYRKNTHTFVNAYLTGKYEVEEEQKYVIKLGDESYLQRYEIDNKNIVTPFRIVGHLKEVAIKFDNKERAEKVAELVEGKVEELEE